MKKIFLRAAALAVAFALMFTLFGCAGEQAEIRDDELFVPDLEGRP